MPTEVVFRKTGRKYTCTVCGEDFDQKKIVPKELLKHSKDLHDTSNVIIKEGFEV